MGLILAMNMGHIKIAGKNYMGLIMDISDNKVEIQRISFEENILYEKPWIIDIPININEFKYGFEKRMENRNKPIFRFEDDADKKIIF